MINERRGGSQDVLAAESSEGLLTCASATASRCMDSALVCHAVIQHWGLVCCMHSCPYTGSSFSCTCGTLLPFCGLASFLP